MSRKIIVAGAGHGGLTAAALLAKAGFDVTIYERNEEGKLGYDWTDGTKRGSSVMTGPTSSTRRPSTSSAVRAPKKWDCPGSGRST